MYWYFPDHRAFAFNDQLERDLVTYRVQKRGPSVNLSRYGKKPRHGIFDRSERPRDRARDLAVNPPPGAPFLIGTTTRNIAASEHELYTRFLKTL